MLCVMSLRVGYTMEGLTISECVGKTAELLLRKMFYWHKLLRPRVFRATLNTE